MLGDGEIYLIHERYYNSHGYLSRSIVLHRGTNYNQMRARFKELTKDEKALHRGRLKYTLDIGKLAFGEGNYR